MAPDQRRERETKPAAIRERMQDMYAMKLAGRSSIFIGQKYGLTKRHVNREIAALPKTVKATLEREHRLGCQSLGKLQPA